jgi:hypothetical protein
MSSATSISTVAPRDRVGAVEDAVRGPSRPRGEVRVDLLRAAHAHDRGRAHLLQPVEGNRRERHVGVAGQGPQRPGALEDTGKAVRFEEARGELAHLGRDPLPVEIAAVEQPSRQGRVRLD